MPAMRVRRLGYKGLYVNPVRLPQGCNGWRGVIYGHGERKPG